MHQYLEQIAGAGDRAAALTRQLLAFSRRQALQPRALDLNGVVSNMERLLRRVIGEDVQLVTIMATDLAPVEADPGQIEQVIMNLAVNARDAMPSGGTLTIETANVDRLASNDQETGEQDGPGVLLTVTDTGHGMDEATRARIFEPFYTTKEPGKGTGLGLSTVYGIVKQSGGNVFVESEPGRGASFRVALPVATANADEGPGPAHGASAEAGTETILVVEDDPGVRAVTLAMLQGLGYAVVEASGGAEALAVMERINGQIDLLFTDMVMPGIGGLELAREVQARYPGLKVLYTSGFIPSTEPGQRSLPPQMAFLHKPFRSADLARKVREVLDQQPAE
jgi:CheY-like chemotaxis protein